MPNIGRPMAASRRHLRPVEKSVDSPMQWSPEVVQALCQRLPGGRMAVTAKCRACLSQFYPCLCPPSGASQLRPPRVVELAERRRLQGNPMGSLRLVKHFAASRGMDKKRLLLLGATDPMVDDHRPRRYALRKGDVLFRHGCEYVVELDGDDCWTQDVDLLPEELRRLAVSVDGDLKLLGGAPLKTISVEYETEGDALGDVELVRMPGLAPGHEPRRHGLAPPVPAAEAVTAAGAGHGFHVQDICEEGPAHGAGVRAGHVLLDLEQFDLAANRRSSATWRPVQSLADVLPGPFALVSGGSRGDGCETPSLPRSPSTAGSQGGAAGGARPARALAWPCRLTFNALPQGWSAVALVDGKKAEALGMQRLKELAAGHTGATIRFERRPYAVISRDRQVVRHEDVWEHEIGNSNLDDVAVLQEWAVASRMTPAQLHYTFKRVTETLTSDLREFDMVRDEVTENILAKARQVLDAQVAAAEEGLFHDQKKALQRELDQRRQELRELLEHVPVYFLMELNDVCGSSRQDDALLPRSRHSSDFDMGSVQHRREVCLRQVAKTRKNLVRLITQNPTISLAKWTPKGSIVDPSELALQELLPLVREQVAEILGGLRSQSGSWAMGLPGESEGSREERLRGGRLSLKDFEVILIRSGISWLTKNDIQRKFEALDAHGSGFLTLGDVLKATHRIKELMRLLSDFRLERGKAGKDLSQADLVREFMVKLLLENAGRAGA